ncbi:pentapeptide repeat-containing protein [Thermomonas hydrothermalis]|uniref:pentapeptide repeat-containing protein n=1 Tax=Thermomonas hydrothermalis TaxID=213588 RepID=UPI003D0C84A6
MGCRLGRRFAPRRSLRHGCGGRLDDRRLSGGRLDGSRLDGSRLDGSRLDGSRLSGSRLDSSRLDSSRLSSGRLSSGRLSSGRLDGRRLSSRWCQPEQGFQVGIHLWVARQRGGHGGGVAHAAASCASGCWVSSSHCRASR